PCLISLEARTRMLTLFGGGVALRTLAKRTCRPRSAIYRMLVEERIARLNRRKGKFFDDPLYHQPDACQVVDMLVKQTGDTLESATPQADQVRLPRDVPSAVSSLCAAPP